LFQYSLAEGLSLLSPGIDLDMHPVGRVIHPAVELELQCKAIYEGSEADSLNLPFYMYMPGVHCLDIPLFENQGKKLKSHFYP
jgi:hypothetical protein